MNKDFKSLSDEDLVELVRKEDQELYGEVVDRYQGKLVRYAVYLISDKDKAQDIVQEAFIKVFVNLHSFNAEKKFSSWIYRIVHNEAINYVKKYKKEIYLEDNAWVEKKLAENSIVEDFAKAEIKKMLNLSLKKLPMNYRDPLVLYYFEDKSYKEISDILRISIGTLSTRINRGKKALKTIYQKNNLNEKS